MIPAASSAKKLGITVVAITPEIVKAAGLDASQQGVAVKDVEHDGPADAKLFQGDVITGVAFPEKIPVHSVDDLQRALSKFKTGDYIGLTVNSPLNGGRANREVNLRIGN